MTEGLRTWVAGRTPRERWLLGLSGVVLLIWVAVTLVWQPIQTQRQASARQAALYDRAIVTLQSDAVPMAVAAPTDNRALNVIVTDAAGGFDLTIRRLEPEGNRIRVTVDEAAFQTVILWLEALQRDAGLRAVEVDLSRRPAPGVVNATLLLER